mmetsp:Transcript_76552/g.206245  ORF Transcript_76552/g.206245 Transcript_76552/m.206245 type:complete len:122 (-) Transcript_76552:90-455(-)
MWSGESVAVTQDSLIGLIAECSDKGGATRGAEDVELGRISEVCVRLGIPPSAVEHALSVCIDFHCVHAKIADHSLHAGFLVTPCHLSSIRPDIHSFTLSVLSCSLPPPSLPRCLFCLFTRI